jgi:trehalose synthase
VNARPVVPKAGRLAPLSDYAPFVGERELDDLRTLARPLAGIRVQHINSTRVGGGVAEILTWMIPSLQQLEIDANWDVIHGDAALFAVTKAIHNALHGVAVAIPDALFEYYLERVSSQGEILDPVADIVALHDTQPLPLLLARERCRGRFIWRCHVDIAAADPLLWERLRPLVERGDAAVYHMLEFERSAHTPAYIMPPAIDPLAEKNRELSREEISEVLDRFGVDRSRPIVLQISRFDRLKDPLGVIEAFRMVRRVLPCQLILAGGGATDDPEGSQVLEEVRGVTDGDGDILVLDLPPTSHLEVNALQRAAAVVVQKSIREGFGLVVTEAMWKARPVVATAVGGIRGQVLHGVTGFLVHTIEGTANRIRQILGNPALGEQMGQAGRLVVSERYLTPHSLKRWLMLMHAVLAGERPHIVIPPAARARTASGSLARGE